MSLNVLKPWKTLLHVSAAPLLQPMYCMTHRSSLPCTESEDYSLSSNSSVEADDQNGNHFSDQELDFLVAILGLLVNLVEKDGENRAGETAGEGKALSWDDKEAVLQGEKEAEKMIVEAHSALLLAFLSTESKGTRNAIAECFPDHKLAILVPVLERFVESFDPKYDLDRS